MTTTEFEPRQAKKCECKHPIPNSFTYSCVKCGKDLPSGIKRAMEPRQGRERYGRPRRIL